MPLAHQKWCLEEYFTFVLGRVYVVFVGFFYNLILENHDSLTPKPREFEEAFLAPASGKRFHGLQGLNSFR